MFKRYLNPYHYPPDVGTPGGTTTLPDDNKEDIIDFLNEEDPDEVIQLPAGEKGDKTKGQEKNKETPETPDETPDEEETPEGEEEVDELAEIEEELEGPTEDKLELVTPVRRKEILSKYPNLFKDFPYLESAYYREQQFTEYFPTPADARVAVEAKEILDKFEGEVLGDGNLETVLTTVRSENINSFHKIVDNFLPTLKALDKDAYFHVMGNTIKATIHSMVSTGRENGDEDLIKAAEILNKHVFNTNQWTPPTSLSKNDPQNREQETRMSAREQAFVKQQFDTAKGETDTRVNNSLRATIEANIDPKKSMTDYVRRNASRDAMEQVSELLNKDTRFRSIVDRLWDKAAQEGFTRESTDRIKSAFVSRAKTLLPAVLKKARIDALRGMGRRVSEESDERPDKKGPVQGGRPRSQVNSGKIKDPKDIPKGMTTLEFLNSE